MGESAKKHNYEYAVDLPGDTAPAAVIRLVGKNCTVLEVGAGPGSITRPLVEKNGCKVTALEIDPTAIEKLRSFCDDIYSVDLNRPNWETELGVHRFDKVVAADVLEHLADPARTLNEMTKLLAPGGHIVLSVPHIGFNGVIATLYAGDFAYKDWGLLDKTHIKFFGIDNIQNLVDGAGLAITDLHFVVRHPERTEFSAVWSSMPEIMRSVLSKNTSGMVYQVVLKAALRADSKDSSDTGLRLRDRLVDVPLVLANQPGIGLKDKFIGWARSHLSERQKAAVKRVLGSRP
jgi:2-polyprenyl-3-methyl-5-hydroxy-6-metoxy-1,4-benzoquinol methylase